MDRKLSESPLYEFGPFLFDPSRRVLSKDGEPVRLTPKVIETLSVFIENRGKVLDKDYLMERLWPDTVVEEANLSQNVSVLRRTLGEKLDDHKYIVTIPGRGYSFVADVQTISPNASKQNGVDIIVQESSRITISEQKEEEESESAIVETLPRGLLSRLYQKTGLSEKKLVALGILIMLTSASGVMAYRLMFHQAGVFDWQKARFTQLAGLKSISGSEIMRPRFSPNGKLITYSQSDFKAHIWVEQVGSKEAFQVTKDPWDDTSPIWSPDGDEIAFLSDRGDRIGIWSVAFVGGPPTLLKDLGSREDLKDIGPLLKNWGSDRSTIYYEWRHNFYALDLSSKQINQLTHFDPSTDRAEHFRISPDERLIVYCNTQDGHSDLWLMPREGGKPTRLTNDPEVKWVPVWCPDSRRIVYSATRDGLRQLFTLDVNEKKPEQITTGEGHGYASDVSSDSKRILSYRRLSEADLYSFDIGSNDERQLTRDVGVEFWPALARDGSHLAYQRLGNDKENWNPESTALAVQSISEQRIIYQVPGGFEAQWSPNTNEMAFLRRINRTYNIWTINAPGLPEKQLTTKGVSFSGYVTNPISSRYQPVDFSWSPDGQNLAYSSRRAGVSNIWVVSSDGSIDINWSDNADSGSSLICPVWSPNGQMIAYLATSGPGSAGGGTTWSIWITDKTHTRQVYQSTSELRLLGWSKDSGDLIVASTEEARDPYIRPVKVKIHRISTGSNKATELAVLNSAFLTTLQMSPGSDSIAFLAADGGRVNVWLFHLSGGLTMVTANQSNEIYYVGIAWSMDGEKLYYGKQTLTTLITMIDHSE